MLPGLAAAWFAVPDISDQPCVTDIASQNAPLKEFALYTNNTAILLPATDYFVPADRLPIDIPLNILSQRYVSTQKSLDRLLIANLRIRMLIKESRELQKKSEKLLKSVSVPYLDKDFLKAFDIFSKNIREEKNRLNMKFREILKQTRRFYSKSSNRHIPPVCDLKSFINVSDARISDKPDVFRLLSATALANSSRQHRSSGFSSTREDKRVSSDKSMETELPWIFRFFLNAIGYTLSHKIEILFYLSVLFIFFYFISLQARR